MKQLNPAFWSIPSTEILQQLETTKQGLSGDEAKERLERFSQNVLKAHKRSDFFSLLISQFKSPIILILFIATCLSFVLKDRVDAFIILSIILISGLLGFWQKRGASNAIKKLLSIVQIKAAVLRGGATKEIPVQEIVPGDIVLLNAGDIVPGDGLNLESKAPFP